MMTPEQHPITPPSDLTDKWNNLQLSNQEILVIAARWGADQELDACANWLADPCAADMPSLASDLRYSRRPKPPTLKEKALKSLEKVQNNEATYLDSSIIFEALQKLPNE